MSAKVALNIRDVLLGRVEEMQKLLRSVPENQWSRDAWGKIHALAQDVANASETMHESANYNDNAMFVEESVDVAARLHDFPAEPLEPRDEKDLDDGDGFDDEDEDDVAY